MKREVAHDLLIPYLDGELDAKTTELLERHLAGDPGLRQTLDQLRELNAAIAASPSIEPDAETSVDIDAILAAERRWQENAPSSPHGARRLAAFPALRRLAIAAVFVVAGLGAGWLLALWRSGSDELVRDNTLAEVQSLRRDVELLRGLLVSGGLSDRSASFRLQAMDLAGAMGTLEPDITDALFQALNDDPSANVRLAALEGLSRFNADPAIRSRLVEALPQQSDPLLQIALIGALVDAGATEARAPIERLLFDPTVQSVVKGAAQQGLTRL